MVSSVGIGCQVEISGPVHERSRGQSLLLLLGLWRSGTTAVIISLHAATIASASIPAVCRSWVRSPAGRHSCTIYDSPGAKSRCAFPEVAVTRCKIHGLARPSSGQWSSTVIDTVFTLLSVKCNNVSASNRATEYLIHESLC